METLAWIVGDVHGCIAELLAVEEAVRRRADRLGHRPLFVVAGDLVDRGPASREVVSHVLRGQGAGTHVSVAGNHEEFFLRALVNSRPDLLEAAQCKPPPWLETVPALLHRRPRLKSLAVDAHWAMFHRLMWLTQGGAETLVSYGCDPMDASTWDIPPDHIRFLCGLPLSWRDAWSVVTHALAWREDLEAIDAGQILARPQIMRVMWSRNVPRVPPAPDRVHVSGHTPVKRVRRSHQGRVVRIDTGVCFGGRLTAYCPRLNLTLSVPSAVDWRP